MNIGAMKPRALQSVREYFFMRKGKKAPTKSHMTIYTRKNAQVATDLQTSCNKSVHKLFTRCIRTACSEFVGTSLEQAVDKL